MPDQRPRYFNHLLCRALLPQAVFLACLGGAVSAPAFAQTPAAAQVETLITFNIPAGTLDQVLNGFAASAGVMLAIDGTLSAGKTSQGLSGTYTRKAALEKILAGTELDYHLSEDQVITLIKRKSVGQLKAVKVSAGAIHTGTSAEGYRATNTQGIGPLAARSLQDTPFSISVVSEELIENTASGSFDQLFKMTPVVQNNAPFTVFGYPTLAVRGFAQSTGVVDGVKLSSYTYGLSTEELERVEVINGLTGFMYGAGNVGGTVNYVLKRPTYDRLTNLTIGSYGNQQGYVHADLSDRMNEDGTFAYRVNALYSDGDTAKEGQSIERKLLSGALDWNLTKDFLLQFEAAHTTLHVDKPDTRFYSAGISYWPDAFDVSETYTPDWNYNDTRTDRASIKASFAINDSLSFRSAYLYKEDERHHIIIYPIYSETGWTLYNPGKAAPYTVVSEGAYAYMDSLFNTGPVQHNLTFGISGDTSTQNTHVTSYVYDSSFVVPTNLTLEQFMDLEMPAGLRSTDYGPRYKSNDTQNTNIMLGDSITFNEQWSSIVGLNYTTIKTKNFSAAGLTTSAYDNSALTPTASVIYKPIQNLSLYVSAIEGLEPGSVVPDDPAIYNNPGEILDPFISTQYELGAKYSINEHILLSSAVFNIAKANSFDERTADGKITRNQDGEQVHRGIELTLTGKVTDNLTIIAGGTLMDLSVEKSTNANLEGKKPIGAASTMAKLYSEYSVAQIPGLTLTGGMYYTGKKYKDSMNTQEIDAYTLFDVGARYQTQLSRFPTSFTLNITNLTNEDYWSSYWQLGIPRNIAFSMRTEF